MKNTLARILVASLDLILPPRCLACEDPLLDGGEIFCGACGSTLVAVEAPCPRCALPETGHRLCHECTSAPPPFASASAALVYGGQLAVAIQRVKYGGASEGCTALGRLLRERTRPRVLERVELVVPVPLHAARLRERGFNQSALLARELVRGRRLPVRPGALRRVQPAPPQVRLDAGARAANVKHAFRASREVAGRAVLLVDDVLTTGATASACSEALLEAGASAVHLLVLARRG